MNLISLPEADCDSRNGKTLGISQPSIEGQESVIISAYKRACLLPEDTVYVEVCYPIVY